MIRLDTENYYSIDDFKPIFEDAFKQGFVKSQKQIEYHKMILAFDIETTSFKDDDVSYNDAYLYNYLKGNKVRVYDVEDIKGYNRRCPEITFSSEYGQYIDEFYDDLHIQWPEWFPETMSPDEMLDNIIYAVDENRPNDDAQKHGIIYCWQLAINGKVIFGRYIDDFINILTYIENTIADKQRVVIYCHNLAFEFQWIRSYIKWSKVFAIAPRKPIFAITEGGIEFRCSYVLTNFSLAKLADQLHHYKIKKLSGDLDYAIIRTPVTPMTRQEIQYCMNDVLVVSAYIQECLFKEKTLYNIPYTATGYCRRYTRNCCLYTKGHNSNKAYRSLMQSLTIEDAEEYLQLKRAFQGGFTHTSFMYSGKLVFNADSLDFTSSYPFALLSEAYPMSKGRKVTITSKEQFDRYIELYCCIFDVEFYDLEPKGNMADHYISASKCFKKEKYVADNGRIESAAYVLTTLTNVDYKIIKHTYKFSKMVIHNMRIYKKGYLPKELIKAIIKLYQDKTTLKGVKGKEQEYLNGKALLNSVYGMMVTDISKEMFIYENTWKTEPADIEKDIARYNHSMKRFLFYPWGVFCTAYARSNLIAGILEFSKDNSYLYSDTDSIKCINLDKHMAFINDYNRRCKKKLQLMCKYHDIDYSELEPMTIKGEKKPLGVYDHETKDDPYIMFKSLGAKRYLTYQKKEGYHLTVAGVNKHTALPYLLETYNDDIFDKFEQSLMIPEDHTGKLTHVYIDQPDSGIVIDDTGQEYRYYSPTAIYMEPASYCFDISEDYINYLKGVIITK